MPKFVFFFTLIIASLAQLIEAFPSYDAKIPNGNRVPHPCIVGDTWKGVGHELQQGQGPLNRFGRDFLSAGKQWTRALCQMDSDGDGKTNGQELGDPNCQWQEGQMPSISQSSQLSHPGVCEPIDSDRCKIQNGNFLTVINQCARILNVNNDNWCPSIKDPSVKSVEIHFNKTLVPSDTDTTYYCQQFSVPSAEDYHVIAVSRTCL